MENNIKLIKCRKCNGNHLTIKCGKNNISNEESIKESNKDSIKESNKDSIKESNKDSIKEPTYKSYDQSINKYQTNNQTNRESMNRESIKMEDYKTKYKVKISNLPNDFEYHEISEFAKEWGTILKINIKNYDNNSIAVLEFKNERASEYFIEALDNTTFENSILKVTKLEN